ncbi:unnamed protein product [Trichobilharzia szidati]|nr:unnamed protein product [Trichobilharzia szidati]
MNRVKEVFCSKCRYIIAVMAFLNCILIYMMRVDLNVTILAMVNETVEEKSNIHKTFFCANSTDDVPTNHNRINVGELNWGRLTQGIVLGAFFWGYIITQIPGGILAFRFGPKWVVFVSLAGCAIIEFCIPPAARSHVEILIFLRVAEGLLQGVMMPNIACLIAIWSPPTEKSRFTAFVFSGIIFGTVLGQTSAGIISQPRAIHSHLHTAPIYVSYWYNVHYLFGIIALIFSLLWIILVYNSPENHPWIGENEKHFLTDPSPGVFSRNRLQSSQSERKPSMASFAYSTRSLDSLSIDLDITQKRYVPWSKIFRSRSVWAILICHVCYNWAFYTLITGMPTYMSRVLGFSIAENGLLSSIPYIAQSVVSFIVAYFSDLFIMKRYLSTTWVRKINNLIALGGLGFSLICVSIVGCNRTGAVVLFSVTVGLMGFSFAGYGSNSLDLAPIYSGNIISITNTAATLPGILGPLVFGYLTRESSSVHNWLFVFSITAGIAWFGALMNLWMTSGEIQAWSRLPNATDNQDHNHDSNNTNTNNNHRNIQMTRQPQTSTRT